MNFFLLMPLPPLEHQASLSHPHLHLWCCPCVWHHTMVGAMTVLPLPPSPVSSLTQALWLMTLTISLGCAMVVNRFAEAFEIL